jgi:ABC-type phosphate/phosphonate transport system substrate-binding protein
MMRAARILGLAAAMLLLAGCGHHAAAPRPVAVKVMVFPEYSLNVMSSRVAPLVERLQRALGPGYRVEWISCPSPEAFMATAERERPDVSLQDAFHTACLARLQQARPILRAILPGGGTTTRGAVVAAEGGPVRTLADLEGRRVAIASRRSYLGYIAQTSFLESRANLHSTAFRFVPVRWVDQIGTVMAQGRADAAFIAETDAQPGERILARTDPVPAACVVTFPHTPAAVAGIVQQTLVQLGSAGGADAGVLLGLGIRGFEPIDAAASREILRLADDAPVPY